MTETRQAEQVRGALGGIVIALATLIAIFAFYALARAETPSANTSGAATVSNGADSVIGAPSASGAAGAGVGASAPLIGAQPASAPAPMVLDVRSNGTALIRGVATAVSGSSITLASWGGSWTIVTTPDTNVLPGGVAGIRVGDFVGAGGVVANGAAMTVNASVVRDWTTAAPMAASTPAAATGAGGASTRTGSTSVTAPSAGAATTSANRSDMNGRVGAPASGTPSAPTQTGATTY